MMIEPRSLYKFVDYFLVKEYGQALGVHGPFAGPDVSLENFTSSSSRLVSMGVPPQSILPAFGWGALEFRCTRTAAQPRCECANRPCVGEQHGYGWALAQASGRNASIKVTATGYDSAVDSAWLSYTERASNEGKTAFYESPQSLGAKYSRTKAAGFRGISMWSVSGACCTSPFTLPGASEVAGMWAAVRAYVAV